MVAGSDNYIAATGLGYFLEKIVIKFLGLVGGGGGIKDVTGHQKKFHLIFVDGLNQPVQKGPKFFMAVFYFVKRPS
jgi:hypothetical protein